uniref:Uncharacterized protein n=1 Tax=Triticum urartu TaxID=4572 RepID=A0A8R7Q6I6_TRIUA
MYGAELPDEVRGPEHDGGDDPEGRCDDEHVRAHGQRRQPVERPPVLGHAALGVVQQVARRLRQPRPLPPALLAAVRLPQRVQHPAPELRLGRRRRRALLVRRRRPGPRLRILAQHARRAQPLPRRQRHPLRRLARLRLLAVAGRHRVHAGADGRIFLLCLRRRRPIVVRGRAGSCVLELILRPLRSCSGSYLVESMPGAEGELGVGRGRSGDAS